jgi:hypothetical protein
VLRGIHLFDLGLVVQRHVLAVRVNVLLVLDHWARGGVIKINSTMGNAILCEYKYPHVLPERIEKDKHIQR